MKSSSIKSCIVVMLIFSLSACSVSPREQSDITPSEIVPLETTKTAEPTGLPNPNLIISDSPDGKYTVELALSEDPILLTILNNVSKQKTQIPISDRYYNKIEDGSSKGFKWFADNKVLIFVLYREPFPEKVVQDFSCFFAVDIEQMKLLTTRFFSLYPHVWMPDDSGVVTIEHGGLNEIFDYYYPETNCYRVTLDSECETSNLTIEGTPWK